jgi:hypothetical protein
VSWSTEGMTVRRSYRFRGVQWHFPQNPASDVAVARLTLPPEEFRYYSLPTSLCATTDAIARESIGVGEELVVVGLFAHHMGTGRNLPIVRSGIIASMPQEPLYDGNTGEWFPAYLAEVRSIGGLSGSPVFALLPPDRLQAGPRESVGRFTFWLLGSVRGHRSQSQVEAAYEPDERQMLNTGIAIVTPITDAFEVIYNEELTAERKRIDAKELENRGPSYDTG